MMEDLKKTGRREFIKVVGLAGGGLFLASFVPLQNLSAGSDDDPKVFAPSVYLKIDSNGVVTIIVHRSELGQGVKTALPMLIAEELEVEWKKIVIEQADAHPKYGDQTTGGSTSIRTSWEPYRVTGATARVMLINAAALRWNVAAGNCFAKNGFVINKLNNEKLSYGDLAEDASKLPVPQNVKLKDPEDFKLIGKRIHRIDTPDKILGKAKFGIDIIIPGVYYTAVSRCPSFGGKVKSFNAAKAKALPGVIDVVSISNGIAVVADSTWHAFNGRDALQIEWDYGPNAKVNTEDIRNELIKNTKTDGFAWENKGDINKEVEEGEKVIEAVYEVPFITHAPLEPMNCVAKVENGKAEIWTGSQTPQDARSDVAKILGIDETNVTVHIMLSGGGFGRRLVNDYVVEASEISKAAGKPIKLTWTREEDMKFSWYRPPSMHVLKGSVRDGKPLKFSHHVIAPSIIQMRFYRELPPQDYDIKEGTVGLEYNIPNMRIAGTTIETHVPISWLRSVYHTQNPFAVESFIDELAYSANKDPYIFRRDMLPDDSRLKNVLNIAAEKSGWGKKLPKEKGMGIAVLACYDSFNAQVAEVTVEGNKIKVDRFTVVIDCGIVVNPDIMENQMQGAIAFGLSAALKGEITIKNGGVVQSNYDDYPILTYNEMPAVEVHYVRNNFKVGGVGEVGIGACAPALCNAIFAATGKRIRKLPVRFG